MVNLKKMTNKELMERYNYYHRRYDKHTEYIENYRQQRSARAYNEVCVEEKENIVTEMMTRLFGKIETTITLKNIVDRGQPVVREVYFKVVGKQSKDDIVVFIVDDHSSLYYDRVIYTAEDLAKEGYKTTRTKDGKILWSKIY